MLAIAVIATLCLRKSSASLRYGIWCFTMLAVLLLPVVSPNLPPLYFGSTTDMTALEYYVAKQINHGNPPGVRANEPDSTTLAAGADQPMSRILASNSEPPGKVVFQYGNFVARVHSDSGHYTLAVLLLLFLIVWIVVAATRFLGIIFSCIAVRKWILTGTIIDDPKAQQLFKDIKKSLSVRTNVKLIEHAKALVPFSVSYFKPVVFLPDDWKSWTEEELQSVFTHELAHVAGNDFFWQLVERFTSALFWFHPLFWYAERCMRIDRELACDDAVLRLGVAPKKYADTLLELAARLKSKRTDLKIPNEAVAMARRNGVKQRIKNILNPTASRRPLAYCTAALIFALVAGAIYGSCLITRRPDERQRLYAIAVKNQRENGVSNKSGKLTKIRCKVLMPDGTQADKKCYVSFRSNIHYRDGHFPFYRFASGNGGNSGSGKINDDGVYEFEDFVGSNTIIQASTSWHVLFSESVIRRMAENNHRISGFYVSKPYTFSPKENNEVITIQLEEPTFLYGVLRYDNGDPAVKVNVGIVQYVKPPFGDDIPSVRNNSTVNSGMITNQNGEFCIPLWPGEFTVFAGGTLWSEPITQKINLIKGKDLETELVIPTPLRLKVILPDGSDAEKPMILHLTNYVPYWRKGAIGPLDVQATGVFDWTSDQHYSVKPNEPGDPYCFYLSSGDNYVAVLTLDKEYGIVQKIDANMNGKEMTITLKPTVSAELNHDTAEYSLCTRIVKTEYNGDYTRKDASFGWDLIYKTDENGKTECKVPVFADDYPDVSLFLIRGQSGFGNGGSETARIGGMFPRKPLREFKGFRPMEGKPFTLVVDN